MTLFTRNNLAVFVVLTLASTALMLSCASPEFVWDEADYSSNLSSSWWSLWAHADYQRHAHGPMAIYLAKLGHELLPVGLGSLENRLRFFEALVGSMAIGALYLALRNSFQTSWPAALVGSGLLLLSVIRLRETHIISPHHVMLLCTLALMALGYQWKDRPTFLRGIIVGAVIAFGAISMTYIFPATLCCVAAVVLTSRLWFATPGDYFTILGSLVALLVTAAILATVLWPPSLLHHILLDDFRYYRHFANFPTVVGDTFYNVTPRWAMGYWLVHLDAPILVFSVIIISLAYWKAFRGGRLSSKHAYLAVYLAFFLATSLAAHIAGSRNLLQFLGVLCCATGALFDEALDHKPRWISLGAGVVLLLAVLNLAGLSLSSSYIPYVATDGNRAFLKENEVRLREPVDALTYGTPDLQIYSQELGIPIAWHLKELPWTTRLNETIPPDVKYILIPAFFYDYLPPDQPMRSIVAKNWTLVWSYQASHAWDLRLYQRPNAAVESRQPPL